MSNLFEKEYKKLNDRQKEAVNSIDGPVLVVAGPGTGKTQLLGMRVANILKKTDTDPGSILCLTYTNKAAINMKDRLLKLIGPEARHVTVHTFHSFAAEIMNQYPDFFWQGAKLSVAPDAVIDDILQAILAILPHDNPLAKTFAGSFTGIKDVMQGLKLAKEAGLTPDELETVILNNLGYIKKIEPMVVDILGPTLSNKRLTDIGNQLEKLPKQKVDNKTMRPLNEIILSEFELAAEKDMESSKTTETGKWKQRWLQNVDGQKTMQKEKARNEWWLALSDVYRQYRQQLHTRFYYDYSDMLVEVLEQLQKDPNLLADIQEKYLYILIDEFQDTNKAQMRLADLISNHYAANNKPNLMAVGDDDQAIFAFNGAELSNMLEFTSNYPTTKTIVLNENYRSSQTIINHSKKIIELAEDRLVTRSNKLSKNLVAKAEPKDTKVKHLRYPTKEHQYSSTAESIQKLWKDNQRDIAVIARTHDSLKQIAFLLHSKNIPIRYEQRSNVFENEAIKQIFLILVSAHAIAQGNQAKVNSTLAELVRHPMFELKPMNLWRLAVENFSQPDWLKALLDNPDGNIHGLGNWLLWLSREGYRQPLPLLIEYVVGLKESTNFTSPLRDFYLKNEQLSNKYLETLSALNLLLGMVREFSKAESNLDDLVRFFDVHQTTQKVLADESWFATGTQAVDLLTVYKAKGLEYENVFIIDTTEKQWQPRNRGRSAPSNTYLQAYGEKNDDYARLMYVAITRAKSHVTATNYQFDEMGKDIMASPLLATINEDEVNASEIDQKDVLESNIRWPEISTRNKKQLLADRLASFSLSPSAFIDYINVAEAGPKVFLERHMLKLPHEKSAIGSYGTAIHAALETAQRLVNTAKLELPPVLDRFEKALIDEHLSPNELLSFNKRGIDVLTRIIDENKLAFDKGALSEQWVQVVTVNNIRLAGKIDVLFVNKGQAIISDYKTGQGISRLETKDKTKQIKAWRLKTQLLFYSLLLKESQRFSFNSLETRIIYPEKENDKKMVLSFTPSAEELDRLMKLIEAVWSKIQKLDFPEVANYGEGIEGINKFEDDILSGAI